MKSPHVVCLLCLALLPLGVAAADDPPMPDAAPGAEAAEGPIEEIEVRGQRSLQTLRVEILDAEVRMFELFNELNSSKLFDVSCGYRQVTGSRIPIWECLPVFMKRAYAQDAQDFLLLGVPRKSDAELWSENREKHEALEAEIRALARQNPAFAQAVLDLHGKRQRLEELEREQRRGGLKGLFSRAFGKDPD